MLVLVVVVEEEEEVTVVAAEAEVAVTKVAEVTRVEAVAIKVEEEATKVEVEATKVEVVATKVVEAATRVEEVEVTRVEEVVEVIKEDTKFSPRPTHSPCLSLVLSAVVTLLRLTHPHDHYAHSFSRLVLSYIRSHVTQFPSRSTHPLSALLVLVRLYSSLS